MAIKVLKPSDPALAPVHQGDKTEAAPVERGGITSPLTSVLAPELEAARSALTSATEAPHGQPIMARSRTGTLYPSETGTGAANAIKAGARGAGGALLDQAEGISSPLGMATMGAAKGVSALAKSPSTQAGIGRLMQMVGDFDLVHPFKSTVGQAGTAIEQSANTAREAALNAERYLPNKSGYQGGAVPSTAQTSRIPYATPTEAPVGPGGLSASDKALLGRQGYSPEMIQRIEQQSMAKAAKPPTAPSVSTPSAKPPISVSPASPMQPPAPTAPPSPLMQQLTDSLAARGSPAPASAPMPSIEGRPLPIYPSAGTVKGVTSNNLEAASNMAFAAGHYDEAERLIDQSLQAFFHGSGGPMAGILAAAIAHKARQVVEPLRANPAFQQAPPAKQQQMIQQALRQPGARGALTGLLGS